MLVVVISDTHGVVRPHVLELCEDADLIIHAGDVGGLAVFEAFNEQHRCLAVKGNVKADMIWQLPKLLRLSLAGVRVLVVHNRKDIAAAYNGEQVVIYGHSHIGAEVAERDGVLYINPGSAGPWRYFRQPSVAKLTIENGVPRAWIEKLRREKPLVVQEETDE